jgi:hypothetical protein
MIYMLEHFFSPTEPSFPIPGQIWFAGSSNEITTPYQLQVYNPRKYKVISSNGYNITIQSDDGSQNATTVAARFTTLGNGKQFTVYGPTYVENNFVQTAPPVVSGPSVVLTVSPATPAASLAGSWTGGWEQIYQNSAEIVLSRNFNANGYYLQNLPTPLLPGDAANKAYVDASIHGGTIYLYNLADVDPSLAAAPIGSLFVFNGTFWTYQTPANSPYLPLAGGTMQGAINMGGYAITNLAAPVNPADAANMNYVLSQPLSSANVTITAPANLNLLSYNSGTLKWVNATPAQAGVLALTGGVMTGAINMGGNSLTGLPTPVHPSDAVPLSYVTGSVSTITSATYNAPTGVLTINQTGSPATITVSGFFVAPGGIIPATEVSYLPPDPTSVGPIPGLFFQSTLAAVPGIDPINVILNPALVQLDLALGNFTVPRQRAVFFGNGTSTYYNFNTGVPIPVTSPLGIQYVTGSGNLAVYVNGIKQIPSDFGFYRLTNIVTTSTYTGVTFTVGGSTLTVTGNHTRTFHPSVNFAVTGTSTTNDGNYTVVSSVLSGTNTVVTVIPNAFSPTPGTVPFVTSSTGIITYGPYELFPSMETGYVYGGSSNPQSLSVSVNGAAAVTLTIDTSTTNCNDLGLLAYAVNAIAASNYINSIVSVSSGSFGPFVVAGNRVAQFPTSTSFVVRNSTNNDSIVYGAYTVQGTPTYNAITNQTTIYVNQVVTDGTPDGIIFQDPWGFTMRIEGGTIVFYSNIAGSLSSVVPTDGGLLSNIVGITWPITISPTLTGTTNPIAPGDYSYVELGLVGYQSSLIQFATAPEGPPTADGIEIVIDREIVYNKFNPFLTAVTV